MGLQHYTVQIVPCACSDWSVDSIKQKKYVLLFFASYPLFNIFVTDGKHIFSEEIWDGVLCKTAERFEDEACGTWVDSMKLH